MNTARFIDTHAHLGAIDFDPDRAEVIKRAHDAGVTRIITIGAGYGIESAYSAIRIAAEHQHVFAVVGLHPNDASLAFDAAILPALIKHPKVVAVGETGLDFYRNYASRQDQERWFIHQIELAKEHNKPLVIHSRSAGADCLKLLKEQHAQVVGGVFHCFAEDAAFAHELSALGFLVSFPGSVTFKKADSMRAVVQSIPLSQIMLETDAPFLAPEPFRGKRCESAFMIKTAECIAALKGISLDELARITSANAERLFKLPVETAA